MANRPRSCFQRSAQQYILLNECEAKLRTGKDKRAPVGCNAIQPDPSMKLARATTNDKKSASVFNSVSVKTTSKIYRDADGIINYRRWTNYRGGSSQSRCAAPR